MILDRHLKGAEAERAPRRLLVMARAAWLVVALLGLGLFLASVPFRYSELLEPPPGTHAALQELGISTDFYASYNITLEIIFAFSFSLVAAIILWRKRNELASVLVSLTLLSAAFGARPLVSTLDALITLHAEWTPLVRLMTYITWVLVFLFFFIFPDGRFVPGWSKGYAVYTTLISIPWNLFPDTPFSPWMWPAPIFIPFELLTWGTCLYLQIYKYRHASTRLQKQQTKWVVYGLAVAMTLILAFYVPRVVTPELNRPETSTEMAFFLVSSTVICLAAVLIPATIGISILRYRLWDIDLIINRTLVYVPLTAILAGSYAASVTLFQKLFTALTGDKSDVAVVISTLILASLFTPVKNGLQAAVDKRFKETPDPTARLKVFTDQVKSVVQVLDYERIVQKLLSEAVAAFGARGGAVYLGSEDKPRMTYKTEEWDGEAKVEVPLKSGGHQLGLLMLGPRHSERGYNDKDRKVLQRIADLVSDAVRLEEPPA